MKYKINSEKILFNHFFTVVEARLIHDRYNGQESSEITRYTLKKRAAVAVILYLEDIDKYGLIKQFRYPVTLDETKDPWIYEIVAGTIDPGDTPEYTAIKEVQEEVGFGIDRLELIQELFLSPGISSELIYLFKATTHSKNILPDGDPHDDEEDIKLFLLSRVELKNLLLSGEIVDIKTWAALQYILN